MKIAICFSGIARGNVERNVINVKNAMPKADFFYATWKEHENDISKRYNAVTYPEPVLHYDSWTEAVEDNPHHKYKAYKNGRLAGNIPIYQVPSLSHSTKQILAHAYQVNDLPEEYDMVVRIRWDVVCGSRINFTNYINRSYNDNIAIGFAIRGGRFTKMNQFHDIPHVYCTEETDVSVSRDWCWWLNDNLIIHPRKKLDTDKVWQLHNDKKLWGGEYGWYQALSENNDHHCVYGGAAIERFVRSAV